MTEIIHFHVTDVYMARAKKQNKQPRTRTSNSCTNWFISITCT